MKGTAKVFRALADPTRRQILEELKNGPLAAGEISGRFSVSGLPFPAIFRFWKPQGWCLITAKLTASSIRPSQKAWPAH